jgi:hypothetical protein
MPSLNNLPINKVKQTALNGISAGWHPGGLYGGFVPVYIKY